MRGRAGAGGPGRERQELQDDAGRGVMRRACVCIKETKRCSLTTKCHISPMSRAGTDRRVLSAELQAKQEQEQAHQRGMSYMSITIHIPPSTSHPQHPHSIATFDSVASGQASKITEEPSAFKTPKHHNCAALLLVYKAIQTPGAASVTPKKYALHIAVACHNVTCHHPSQHVTTCRVTLPCSCENRRERRCRTQCQCCGARQ